MSGPKFDWRVAEESHEDTAHNGARQIDLPTPAAPSRQRWHWRTVLIVLLIVGLASAAVYMEIARRAEEATADMKKDVLASHNLMQRAVAQSDADLLDTILPNDDPGWRNVQRALFSRGLLFNRDVFGLKTQPADSLSGDVILSPDLKEAEVVAEQAYAIDIGRGMTQTIHLRHTSLYRFNGLRWQLSRPDDDFWGRPITVTGQILTLSYPERDRAIGERLARELDAVLDKVCIEVEGRACLAGRRMRVNLTGGPFSLISMAETGGAFVTSRDDTPEFTLPTPSLFGLPIDEAGYQALYHVYAARVVNIVADHFVGVRRRESQTWFYQSARDELLIELGLRPWPLVPVDDTRTPPPIPPPDQDIAVYCVDSLRQGGSLYRYTPSTGAWSKEFSGRVIASMARLPDGEGIVLQESLTPDGAASRLILWQDEHEQVLLDALKANDLFLPTVQTDASGRRVAISLHGGNIASGRVEHILLDLDRCSSSHCEWTALSDLPIWSPDASHTIVPEGGLLFLGDADGQSLARIGIGHNPFWLDNVTYGYITENRFGVSHIVTATVANATTHVLLNIAELSTTLPEASGRLGLYNIPLGWASGKQLLLSAYNLTVGPGREGRIYWLQLDPRSGAVTPLPIAGEFNGFALSPDGRWLVGSTFDPVAQALSFHFFDIERGEMRTPVPDNALGPLAGFYVHDNWSTDGQWFLSLSDGVLYLIAPEHDYYQTIIPELPGCIFAAWINSE